ncbi:ABC transporter substrate-binding protein [Marispirochaeta aestuarii]|uniref:ABC transporter substrate-binding protein n=1 Tax=Marispirochaeta aestuarii TaxID=1963862 RepID=UPI0029C737C6|nr:ABC transporter substrate-binding protein [Marispirochaeta aestuarii]
MKKKTAKLLIIALVCAVVPALLVSCTKNDEKGRPEEQKNGIILGFSQIGAESAWRKCNTRSIKAAATESGVQLLFSNAEQKQNNQIKAIRSFIAYQVDVIAFVPIVADGWDNVLREAQDAGIPVLITDRKINTDDESLYAGFIGTDSEQEGREAGKFLLKKFENSGAVPSNPVRIIEISGTEGSSPAKGRAAGFREIISEHPEYKIIYSESGDFLRSKGNEIMRWILDSKYKDFDVVFSHNDGMTLGILEVMKERGMNPGKDIVIITVDAEQAAIDALGRGEVNCVIECNPKFGPAIMSLSKKLAKGQKIPRLMHVHEEVFTEDDDVSAIPPRGY